MVRAFLLPAERALLVEIAAADDADFAPGRQHTGYQKLGVRDDARLLPLIERSLAQLGMPSSSPFWDAWLLRYPRGSSIPAHTDVPEASGVGHHRLNALVTAPDAGGILVVDGSVVDLGVGDAIVFRPDLQEHAVSAIEGGARLVWSVGCWKPTC